MLWVCVSQLLDSDQELYKNFPLVISERWQQEVAETVYDAVNSDTDKNEMRKRAKNKQQGHEEGEALTQKTETFLSLMIHNTDVCETLLNCDCRGQEPFTYDSSMLFFHELNELYQWRPHSLEHSIIVSSEVSNER